MDRAVLQAKDLSELQAVQAFPVFYDGANQPHWEPLPIPLIKDAKKAVAEYGLSSAYAMGVIGALLQAFTFTPNDLKDLAQTLLNNMEITMFLDTWYANIRKYAHEMAGVSNRPVPDTIEMLFGVRKWAYNAEQMRIDTQDLITTKNLAFQALQTIGGVSGTQKAIDLGLVVIPALVRLVNANVVSIFIKPTFVPIELSEEDTVAQLLPIHAPPSQEKHAQVAWSQLVTLQRPTLSCEATFPNGGQKIKITGLLDTGADVTIIAEKDWPKDGPTFLPSIDIRGVGGIQVPRQSSSPLLVKGSEDQLASSRPFILNIPVTLWGRDVISQWGLSLKTPYL
ncbi:hypothetical protein WISP_04107 [Willisornis vidua]|uniref:Peptidase A2 domain-containing protein n=1 Tax=Willisornis vidua TaxID=1566151 RepID=A0ABQ9DYQ4_9PASS|nr:hypothetical protein WISP_04107 [Willisornis vidua]